MQAAIPAHQNHLSRFRIHRHATNEWPEVANYAVRKMLKHAVFRRTEAPSKLRIHFDLSAADGVEKENRGNSVAVVMPPILTAWRSEIHIESRGPVRESFQFRVMPLYELEH